MSSMFRSKASTAAAAAAAANATPAQPPAGLPADLPLYHEKSALRNRPGYYPNLSQAQLEAVRVLQQKIEAAQLQADNGDEVYFLKLLRFLRARKFHPDNAFEMIKNDVKWREEDNRAYLMKLTSEEVLQIPTVNLFPQFPAWLQGFDKEGRPVLYKKFGYFETSVVLKMIDMTRLIRYHSWQTEMTLRVMRARGLEHHYNAETITCIIDAHNWTTRLATSDAYTFIKHMAVTDSDHYPERLGSIMIINAPTALSFAFNVVKPFLDDITKAKVQIFTSKSQWIPALSTLIDRDQIPVQYGGTAPNLTPEECVASMNPGSTIITTGSTTTTGAGTGASAAEALSPEEVEALVAAGGGEEEVTETAATESEIASMLDAFKLTEQQEQQQQQEAETTTTSS